MILCSTSEHFDCRMYDWQNKFKIIVIYYDIWYEVTLEHCIFYVTLTLKNPGYILAGFHTWV